MQGSSLVPTGTFSWDTSSHLRQASPPARDQAGSTHLLTGLTWWKPRSKSNLN